MEHHKQHNLDEAQVYRSAILLFRLMRPEGCNIEPVGLEEFLARLDAASVVVQ